MPRNREDEKQGAKISIKAELVDEVLKEYRGPQDFDEIFKQFKKAVVERALGAELTQHLGYDKGQDKPERQSNHRNGSSGKRIITDQGSLEIEVPRDRESSFEPQLIKKGERRFSGFDDKIIAMYARGMTVREIQGYLEEMYEVVVSPDLISCRVPPDSEHGISESNMAIGRRLKPPGGRDGQTESMERREALPDRQRSAESKRAGGTNRQTASGIRGTDLSVAG